MKDEDFFRHLYKQIEENKRYEGFTTIRSLEHKYKNSKYKTQIKNKNSKKNWDENS